MRSTLRRSALACAGLVACSADPVDRPAPPVASAPASTDPVDPRAACLRAHPVEAALVPVVRALCSELHSLGGVSASVAIAQGDRVRFSLAHGPRCRGRPEPLEPTTALRIGSITKPITATVVLDIAARMGVHLDDSLAATLPELDPPVTLRSLLGHTTGLRDLGPFELLALGPSWERASAAERDPPGSFRYANANYLFAGRWLEQVTHDRFAHLYATEPVLASLRPLVSLDAASVDQPGCGHRWLLGWRPIALPDEPPLPAYTLPAGGGLASAESLARVPAALVRTGQLDTMLATRHPTEQAGVEYGLGVRVMEHHGELVLAHAGNSGAHWAELWWSPSHGVAVAVLSSTPQPFKSTLLAAFDVALVLDVPPP